MHPINEIHGFPPVTSELEDFGSELRQSFEQLRPALIGGFAYYLLLLAFTAFLR